MTPTVLFLWLAALAAAPLTTQAPPPAPAQPSMARLLSIPRPDGTQQLWEIGRERYEALVP